MNSCLMPLCWKTITVYQCLGREQIKRAEKRHMECHVLVPWIGLSSKNNSFIFDASLLSFKMSTVTNELVVLGRKTKNRGNTEPEKHSIGFVLESCTDKRVFFFHFQDILYSFFHPLFPQRCIIIADHMQYVIKFIKIVLPVHFIFWEAIGPNSKASRILLLWFACIFFLCLWLG